MDEKKAYQDKFRAQLDEWEAQIDELRAKLREAGADARLKYMEEMEDLKGHQKKAEARLDALNEAGGDAWKDLKKGTEAAWDQLEAAVKRARSRFS